MANTGKVAPYIPIDPVIIWTKVNFSTAAVHVICDQVMLNVMKETGKNYKEFKAVFYMKSVIYKNYVIKVYVGNEKYLHLSVGLSASPSGEQVVILKGVQKDHKWNDDLIPFNYEN
ncbi:PREDICTED: cystatin-A-like [Poecilia mexicana]|uniref:cystatin-A-like n=1 Tax=Poecilia mexicana TaxID=48701 RepID=UPI00072DB887|nr:PREDICTED: cystatin-A-like [Poecilia mexicana]